MTAEEYEEKTLCTKELIDEPCDEVGCIYYKECMNEWEGMDAGKQNLVFGLTNLDKEIFNTGEFIKRGNLYVIAEEKIKYSPALCNTILKLNEKYMYIDVIY